MRRSSFHRLELALIGLMLLWVSPAALASGDVMLVYYTAGAVLLQLALLVVTCVQWRRDSMLVVAMYTAISAVVWHLALKTRADFCPLATTVAVAVLPWAVCLAVRALLARRRRSERGGGN